MNDRLSAFCTGVGFAGLVVGYGVFAKADWVIALVVAWSVILVPMGVIDFVLDTLTKRRA